MSVLQYYSMHNDSIIECTNLHCVQMPSFLEAQGYSDLELIPEKLSLGSEWLTTRETVVYSDF